MKYLVGGLWCLVIVACGSSSAPHAGSDASRDAFVIGDVAGTPDSPPDGALIADASVDAPVDAPLDAGPDAGVAILSVDATSLDIGGVDIGVATGAQFNLTNSGSGSAVIQVSFTGDRQLTPSISTFTIWPNYTQPIPVSCLTYITGQFNGTLSLSSGTWHVDVPVHAESNTQLYVFNGLHGTVAAPTKYTGDLVLHAVPDADSELVAWSDPTCGTQLDCTLHQEAVGRSIRAYFAPTSSVRINITPAGNAPVIVRVDDTFTTDEIAACRTACSIPVPQGRTVRVTATSLFGDVTLSGACAGTRSCTFTANTTTVLTATALKSAKDGWARELGTAPLVSARYDSQGNLLVVTDAFDAQQKQVIKLDAQGKTIWAHPFFAGRELAIAPNDGVYVRRDSAIWWLDRDGYLIGYRYDMTPIGGGPTAYQTVFQHRLAPNSTLLSVMGNGSIAGLLDAGGSWTASLASQSLRTLDVSASTTYVAAANASGGTDLLTYNNAGVQGPTISGAAPHQGTAIRVLSNGDLATISATATEVSVRRITTTTTVFAHDIAVQDTAAPNVSIAETGNNELFAIWGGNGPVTNSAVGYDAAVFDATGTMLWSVNRPEPNALSNVLEVYDVASHGSNIAIVGSLLSVSPDAGHDTNTGVVYGAGFVQTFTP